VLFKQLIFLIYSIVKICLTNFNPYHNSNGLILKRTEGFNYSSTSNASVSCTDFYTIPQLNTADEGRNIQCEVIINVASSEI